MLPYRYRYRRRLPLSSITDPDLREIVACGDLRIVDEDEPPPLSERLAWELQSDTTLKVVWRRFATYDQLANRLRRAFERFQAAILVLGILATLLALVQTAVGSAALHLSWRSQSWYSRATDFRSCAMTTQAPRANALTSPC